MTITDSRTKAVALYIVTRAAVHRAEELANYGRKQEADEIFEAIKVLNQDTPGPYALYWGDGDWTCSFECGELYGNQAGWFSRWETAQQFWDHDDSPTFSVWAEHDIHGEPGDFDYLAPGQECLNCGKVLRDGE